MEQLGLLLFDLLLGVFYILISFAILLTTQLISYRIFNFNLYKWLTYNLIDKEVKEDHQRF